MPAGYYAGRVDIDTRKPRKRDERGRRSVVVFVRADPTRREGGAALWRQGA